MLSLCLESGVSYSLIKELTDYSYNEVRSNKRQKEQYNELSRTYIHRADDIYKH